MEEKALILRNKSKLRSTSHPEDVRNVFITPDFTPIEQKRNKGLQEQLINMNKTENIYIIKKWEDSVEENLASPVILLPIIILVIHLIAPLPS